MRGHVRKLAPTKAGEPRWQVIVNSAEGREQRTIRGSRADADALARRMVEHVEAHRATPGTFGELVTRWLRRREEGGHRTERGTAEDRAVLDRWASELFPVKLSKLTANRIEDHYSAMRKKGVGATMHTRVHRLLAAALNAGVKWGDLHRTPMVGVTTPSPPRTRPRAVTVDTLRVLLADLDDRLPDIAALALVAALTGMRTGELLGLQWGDIDHDRGLISVRRRIVRDVGGAAMVEDGTKTDERGRIVAASAPCLEALRLHHARRQDLALKVRRPLGPWVWSTEPDSSVPGRPDWPSRAIGRWARANGHQVTMHGLRHTYATLALASGVDIATVSKELGHSRRSTTLDVYAEAIEGRGHQAANAVAAMIR